MPKYMHVLGYCAYLTRNSYATMFYSRAFPFNYRHNTRYTVLFLFFLVFYFNNKLHNVLFLGVHVFSSSLGTPVWGKIHRGEGGPRKSKTGVKGQKDTLEPLEPSRRKDNTTHVVAIRMLDRIYFPKYLFFYS